MPDSLRSFLALPAILLLAAAPAGPRLQPGLWQFTNVPTGASLDGRALDDLPYTPPTGPQSVCVSPADAADPARFFARDSGSDCRFSQRNIAGGRVAIAGTCPPHDDGQQAGSVHLTGRWSPTSYTLRFATITNGENGRMGFTGTMTGKRVGDCPAT